jgi:nucleoid-associated protein YgaU
MSELGHDMPNRSGHRVAGLAGISTVLAAILFFGAYHPQGASRTSPGAGAPISPEAQMRASAKSAAPSAIAPPGSEAAHDAVAPEVRAPQAAAAAAIGAPRFDLVRVGSDGSAVVAGTAVPGDIVTVHSGETSLVEVEADGAGNFVAVFRVEPSTEPQALTLRSADASGAVTASSDVVVLLPAAPGPALAAPTGAGAPPEAAGTAATDAPLADDRARDAAAPPRARARTAAPAPKGRPAQGAPEIGATAILRGGVAEVAPIGGPPADGLTLASISYGDTGFVRLAGLADAGARVRVYVDDAFASDGAADADGRWRLEIRDIAAGVHRLRIDAIDEGGAVTERIATPFQRDTPRPAADGEVACLIVQPGNSLWTLARIHYGAGVRFTRIYNANQELIRDPALIFPGQIFALPADAVEPVAD